MTPEEREAEADYYDALTPQELAQLLADSEPANVDFSRAHWWIEQPDGSWWELE